MGLLESLFNDQRCPICRYEIDYKQIKAKFDFNLNHFIDLLNNIISESISKKIVIVSKYDNLIIYLKSKIKVKSSTIFTPRNLNKVEKFNVDENRRVLFLKRKFLNYQLGDINTDHFIFTEPIWDDELDQYFGISNFLNNNIEKTKIDILIPNI